MDAFLARHVNNPINRIAIPHSELSSREPPPMSWCAPTATLLERHNASAKYAGPQTRSKAGSKAGSKASKKKKRKRSKAGSVTSDGTDNGSCWSGYKRTKGYKKGSRAKGSCEPK